MSFKQSPAIASASLSARAAEDHKFQVTILDLPSELESFSYVQWIDDDEGANWLFGWFPNIDDQELQITIADENGGESYWPDDDECKLFLKTTNLEDIKMGGDYIYQGKLGYFADEGGDFTIKLDSE